MSRFSIASVVLGLMVTASAQADSTVDDNGGYWDHVKTDWLGQAPGAKPFYFRAGYTLLAPDASSSEVTLSNVGGVAQLAIDNGPIPGSAADVDSVSFPSVIVGYELPWGDGHWSVETILALPLTVKFTTAGTLQNESIAPFALGNIPTGVPALGEEFGETKALPPVVTFVYRFWLDKPVRPYVGAGLAMLFAFDSEVTNPVLTAVNKPELKIDPVMGYAVQGGVEFQVWQNWWINADVKFVGGLEATATVSDVWVEVPLLPTYEVAQVGDASVDVTVDPWVFHVGVGFNF